MRKASCKFVALLALLAGNSHDLNVVLDMPLDAFNGQSSRAHQHVPAPAPPRPSAGPALP
jgi:hypothetical protein